MEYLLKVSAVIVIFYGIYRLFLERDTFFEINRSFLLFGLILSFLLPLWTIPVYYEYIPQSIPVETIQEFTDVVSVPSVVVEEQFNIWEYLPFVYSIGVVSFLIFFLFRLITLLKSCIKSKSYKQGIYTIIEVPNDISPFSFFNWIVFNPSQFNHTELEQIIAHEKIHAKQYHSIDILLMELCCALLWFHPLVWLYNKSLKQNLEFLADKYALHQFENKKSYQYTLLKASIPAHQMALSNQFYNSLIKKRIAMLQKTKSKRINLLKYALVIPVLALFLMGFNTEDVYVERGEDKVLVIINKNTTSEKQKEYKEFFKEGLDIDFISKNIKSNLDNERVTIDVELINNNVINELFSIIYNGKEKSLKVNKKNGLTTYNNFESYNFISFLSTIVSTKFLSKLEEEVKKDSLNTNSKDSIIKMKPLGDLRSDNASEIHYGKTPKYRIVESGKRIVISNDKSPLCILDGKEISKEEMINLNSNDIKSINILKGKEAVDKYGKKGDSGAIELSTKEDQQAKITNVKSYPDIKVVSYEDGVKNESDGINQYEIEVNPNNIKAHQKPSLYIVDGKEVSEKEHNELRLEEYKQMNVFKGKSAIEKYGEKGRNGVVEIMTEEKDNEFKMFLDKNTSDKKLKYYKKHYQEKLDKEFNYKVKRNTKKEIIFFDFKFEDRGSMKTEIDKFDNEPIKNLIITVTKGTNVLDVVEYGKDS